jgi:hypothetical protein
MLGFEDSVMQDGDGTVEPVEPEPASSVFTDVAFGLHADLFDLDLPFLGALPDRARIARHL